MKSTIFELSMLYFLLSSFLFSLLHTIRNQTPINRSDPTVPGHLFLALESLPKLDNFEYNGCPVFGAAYEKQLRALTAAPHPAKGAIAEASTFFSAYAAWRSSEEATIKRRGRAPGRRHGRGAGLVPPFMLLTRAPASMDKEWLLLPPWTTRPRRRAGPPLERVRRPGHGAGRGRRAEAHRERAVIVQRRAAELVSSLGAFLGRYRVAEGKALYASDVRGVRGRRREAFGDLMAGSTARRRAEPPATTASRCRRFRALCDRYKLGGGL